MAISNGACYLLTTSKCCISYVKHDYIDKFDGAGSRQNDTGSSDGFGSETDKQLVYKSKEAPLETVGEHAVCCYGKPLW